MFEIEESVCVRKESVNILYVNAVEYGEKNAT